MVSEKQWILDISFNKLQFGEKFCILSIFDEINRQCLAIEIGGKLPAQRVTAVLEQLELEQGLPEKILVDNGADVFSTEFCDWFKIRGVEADYIELKSPCQMGFIERAIHSLERDVLDGNTFKNISDIKKLVLPWKKMYNDKLRTDHDGFSTG